MDKLIYYFFSEKENEKKKKKKKISSDYSKDLLKNQANECTRLVVQAIEKHIAKMSAKLHNPNAAPKTYWFIIIRFLNRRKFPAIPPDLADGKLVSYFNI